ncbi:MAG TPA: glycosyltransferase family 39 protein [Myxococcota bacterium]|nr:glycosyltransferase family 39 protein [Myxococcota bacterium]
MESPVEAARADESAQAPPRRVGAISRGQRVAAVALIAVACVGRFLFLETSPPGFFADEAAGAAHVMCLQRTGKNCHDQAWPLFSAAAGGGVTTPTYLYLTTLWAWLFGTSPGAFRAEAALVGVVTLLGLYRLAAHLLGAEYALWVALSGAIAPWSFQFSRIAWDPPLAPCFLIWGLFLLVARRGTASAAAAGALWALAMYSYPPTRLQVPLMLGGIACFTRWAQLGVARLVLCTACLCVAALPLANAILFEGAQDRFGLVGIFSAANANPVAGAGAAAIAWQVFENVALHLDPRFLFITGDSSLRHSTGLFGMLSGLDLLALLAAPALVLSRGKCWKSQLDPVAQQRLRAVIGLAALGILSGILPAALTWESLPHSLRAIGAWPFLCLLSGALLGVCVASWRWLPVAALAVAYGFSALFIAHYFARYPELSHLWWDTVVLDRAREAQISGDWSPFEASVRDAPLAAQYYRMHFGAEKPPD